MSAVVEQTLSRIRYQGLLEVAKQDTPLPPLDIIELRKKHAAWEQLSLL